jgi:hypothetical protein
LVTFCETAFVIGIPFCSGKPAAMNWLNNATTWSTLGGLLGGAPLVVSVVKIGGSVTLTLTEDEVAVSPVVVFDAVTVNMLTGDPFPLKVEVSVRSVMEAPGVVEVIVYVVKPAWVLEVTVSPGPAEMVS